MAFCFGDSFDLYQQFTDAYMSGSYWDSGTTGRVELSSSGRFSGSRGLIGISVGSTTPALVKSSGQNDAVHHINIAAEITTALSGTNQYMFVTFFDGTTAQCSIVFQSSGSILLTSGLPTGTTLATYAGAISAINTWYSFEIEVVINNATGRFRVRKNGNTSDDYDSGASLNTRASANNYANKIGLSNYVGSQTQLIDDFLWRSDPSSVSWAGDVRCYTRLPASDGTVQFTRSGSVVPVTPYVQGTTGNIASGTARYSPFFAACSGTIGSAILTLALGYTGNAKCTLFNDNNGAPGTVLGSATAIANPVAGNNPFTFASPPSVTQGSKYWIGFDMDTVVANGLSLTTSNFSGAYTNSGVTSGTAYASFPVANPSVTTGTQCNIFTVNITPTTAANANLVADPTQDGAGGYVYDATSGDQDLYNLQAISATPTNIVAVTTRAIAQKSDAGTRNIALQLKSGTTTSNGTSTALNTSFAHIYRTDTTDPNTSAAWTATAVNNLQCGMKVTA